MIARRVFVKRSLFVLVDKSYKIMLEILSLLSYTTVVKKGKA